MSDYGPDIISIFKGFLTLVIIAVFLLLFGLKIFGLLLITHATLGKIATVVGLLIALLWFRISSR